MKAMIFAAGLGTRLFPLTKETPKALVKINDKTLLEIVLERLISQGIKDVIINVHHFAEQIVEFLKSKKNFGINIHISNEDEDLLDTGGGLKKASYFFGEDESFIVHNVDVISDIDLNKIIDFHNKSGALATLAVRNRKTSRYLLFDSENYLCGWKNELTGKQIISREISELWALMAFSGIYVFSANAFSYFKDKSKFSIIDVFLDMAKDKKVVAYPHNESLWADVGRIASLKEAKKVYESVVSSQ